MVLRFNLLALLGCLAPLGAFAWSPFWAGKISNEPLLFIQKSAETTPCATLLFSPSSPVVIKDQAGELTFMADIDYEVKGRKICLTAGSKIPVLPEARLFPARGAQDSIEGYKRKRGVSLLFSPDGALFHSLQVAATYAYAAAEGAAFEVPSKKNLLPKTTKAVAAGERVALLALGDSITQGQGSSGLVGRPPNRAGFLSTVVETLQIDWKAHLLANQSFPGARCEDGFKLNYSVPPTGAVLVLIAYGTNDSGSKIPPNKFVDCVERHRKAILLKNPSSEFIVLSSMPGNPEWSLTSPGLIYRYRDALRRLEKPGVVMADVYGQSSKVLQSKKYLDLSSNGINHPNDFGHQIYSDVVLASLGISRK